MSVTEPALKTLSEAELKAVEAEIVEEKEDLKAQLVTIK